MHKRGFKKKGSLKEWESAPEKMTIPSRQRISKGREKGKLTNHDLPSDPVNKAYSKMLGKSKGVCDTRRDRGEPQVKPSRVSKQRA